MRSVLDLGSNGGRRYHRVAECGSPRQPPHRRTWLVVCCLSVGSLCSVLIQPAVAQAAPSVWSVTNSPNEGSGQDLLFDVSCVTSTFCMAVGYFYNVEFEKQTLVESLAGGTWSWDSSPSAGLDSYLYGVSCSSSTSCIAVGYYTNSSGDDQTLAESWNGSEWSITPTPNSSTSDDYLQGVSCYGQSNCVAVGYGYPSDVSETLVESWDGNTWSIVSSPSEADDSYLDGVSCTGSMHCQAVGYYQDDSIDSTQTLAESWNGSSWSITSSPSPGNGNGTELFGVSCPKVSSCVAVGFYGHTYRTLVESWNGDTWSVVRSPNPKSLQTELFGVSCQKSNDCVAVGGYYTRPDREKTLVESWNGSKWSITPSPSPQGTDNVRRPIPELDGVSCSGSTDCVAVGHYLNRSKVKTLVETGS